jgi:hypothetical protein
MYYLTFLLPDVQRLLERQGFRVTVHADAYTGPLTPLQVVVATKH